MPQVCNQVNVVGHDDETASEPMMPLWAVEQERNEPLERVFVVQDTGTAIHAHPQEIRNIPLAIRPDAMQAAKAARGWSIGIGAAR